PSCEDAVGHAVSSPFSPAPVAPRLHRSGDNNHNKMTICDSLSANHRLLLHRTGDALTPRGAEWYACGPTVDGPTPRLTFCDRCRSHGATPCRFAQRPLFVVNITDVEDKFIPRMRRGDGDPLALARRCERKFWRGVRSQFWNPRGARTGFHTGMPSSFGVDYLLHTPHTTVDRPPTDAINDESSSSILLLAPSSQTEATYNILTTTTTTTTTRTRTRTRTSFPRVSAIMAGTRGGIHSTIDARCFSSTTKHNNNNSHSSNGGGNGLTVYDSLSSSHRLLPHQLTITNDDDDNTTKGVAWYACGPTVYDSAHLGHARTYVTLDILRRISLHHSYHDARPMLVMNITDVDDKIIARSQRQQQLVHDDSDDGGDVKMMDPLVLARRYETEFWKDMDRLNVLRPDVVCRVSEHVEGTIVPYIERIVEGGMAYVVPEGRDSDGDENREGSVYFDVRAFESKARGWTRYGKLAPEGVASESSLEFFSWDSSSRDGRQSINNGAVVEEEEDASLKKKKRDPRDFCLWKYRPQSKNNNDDNNNTLNEPASVSYPSPWGIGRPGWHVECSAMIQRLSQDFQSTHQFYVHAGGVDLKFPHHANEIAQAEAFGIAQRCGDGGSGGLVGESDGGGNSSADRKEWIPHWIHTGHLYVRGRKMSKSLKNFITIREMLDNHNDNDNNPNEWSSPADDFRLWCLGLSGSYRGPATYSPTRMEEARVIREKWIRFLMEGQQCLDRWHQVRRDDGNEEEDGDCTNHPKIWKDNDLELFRTVTQSNGNCRRALMGHTSQDGGKGSFDLDGASFVREITYIATMGMKYLEETRNNNVLTAAEPLMFALTSLRELLALVGFTEKTFEAGLSSVSSGQQFGDESNQQSWRDRALVDAVVAFRAAVRTSAIDGIRNKDGMSAVKDVLRLCDELRDDIMPSLGVEVLDGKAGAAEGETGAWRNSSPRERSADKR
ncbi:hypothetical protein HJC23_007025, partial [Cyclotella cryptica]